MDIADPTLADAAANHGLKSRYQFNSESCIVEMAGAVFCDVFFTERLLLSYVDLKVILNRSDNTFCLMSAVDGADFKVKMVEVYLEVIKVKVNSSVSLAHEVALKKSPAYYPIRRVECKSFIIPAGNPSLQKDNVFSRFVQRSFVFGLVENAAFNGDFKKDRLTFNILTCLLLAFP